MKDNKNKILEEVVVWFKDAGFDNDLSLFVAGILDIGSGIDDIQARILPALLEITPTQSDEVLRVIEDLRRQLEHISKHAEEIRSFGDKASNFFDPTASRI